MIRLNNNGTVKNVINPHFSKIYKFTSSSVITANFLFPPPPGTSGEGNLGDTLTEKLRMMDSIPSDEETEQQRDSQFMGAASIISTDGEMNFPLF